MPTVSPLTAEQRANLFRDGATQITQTDGRIFYSNDTAYRTTAPTMVNTTTDDFQGGSHAASLAGGVYLVAWRAYDSGFSSGVFAQRFDASGAMVGAETRVNTTVAGNQDLFRVLPLAGGGAMVVWSQDSQGYSFYGQRMDVTGAKVGGEVLLGTTDYLLRDSFEALTGGGFVRVSYHDTNNLPERAFFGQRYDASGAAVGAEFRISPPNTGNNGHAQVAALSDGGFLISYFTSNDNFASRVHRYDASGVQIGATLSIAGGNGPQSITALAADHFVLTRGISDVTAQVYALDGTPVGASIHFTTSGANATPVVTALADGGFVMNWQGNNGSGIGSIQSARFDAAGVMVGEITPLTPPIPYTPIFGVAPLPDGGLVLTYDFQEFQPADVLQTSVRKLNYSVLKPGADFVVAAQGAGDLLVVTTPDGLNGTDSLTGGGTDNTTGLRLVDVLELSASGVLNLTAPAVFAEFEKVLGASGDDTFVLRAAQLSGLTTIDGRGGSDTLSFTNEANGVDVGLGASRLVSIENLVGGAGADTLAGDAGANRLDGGAGADRLYGWVGNDSYLVDSQGDLVFESPNEGTDTVTTTGDYYLYANIENLTLASGAGSILGVGNELANVLTGNASANTLLGGLGDDTVNGGDGADRLFGEGGTDFLNGQLGDDYLVGGDGADLMDGGEGADALYGQDGVDMLIGGAGVDTLVGGAGNDALNGASGAGEQDLMDGGAGDDDYLVDAGNDLTFEAAGGGTDTVTVSMGAGGGYYLYANVENMLLIGQSAYGVGNELANVITGNEFGNWLLGGDGNDTLNGKVGNDVLFGQGGADTFVFQRGTGGDVIGDFQVGIDKIQLTGIYTSFDQVHNSLHQNGGDTAIDLGAGDFVVLNGVAVAALTAADFVL